MKKRKTHLRFILRERERERERESSKLDILAKWIQYTSVMNTQCSILLILWRTVKTQIKSRHFIRACTVCWDLQGLNNIIISTCDPFKCIMDNPILIVFLCIHQNTEYKGLTDRFLININLASSQIFSSWSSTLSHPMAYARCTSVQRPLESQFLKIPLLHQCVMSPKVRSHVGQREIRNVLCFSVHYDIHEKVLWLPKSLIENIRNTCVESG